MRADGFRHRRFRPHRRRRGDTFVTVRSVDTLVKRLRRRIEPDPAHPRCLLTVWGVGYKFADM